MTIHTLAMSEPGISATISNTNAKESEGTTTAEIDTAPQRKLIGRPFQKGVSGNLAGRPKIEPRVRRYARKYDRKMCRVLAEIAMDPKVPSSERRRSAMDLVAIGSGRPALVQEISGRDGVPVGPLIAMNFGAQPGQALTPAAAYAMMCSGALEPDPNHPAFQPQPDETVVAEQDKKS